MPDIATIGAALASIKTATEIARLIKDSGASLEQAEVKLQIANLISSLADAKIELAELQTLLHQKDQEILQLNSEIAQKNAVIWHKPYYIVQTENGNDGPFCPTCYDSTNKLIRLQGSGNSGWRCYICKGFFKDSDYRDPPPIRFG